MKIAKALVLTTIILSSHASAAQTFNNAQMKKEKLQISDYCANVQGSIHNIVTLRLLGVDFSESLSRFEDPILINSINNIYFNYTEDELKNATVIKKLQQSVLKECYDINDRFLGNDNPSKTGKR